MMVGRCAAKNEMKLDYNDKMENEKRSQTV